MKSNPDRDMQCDFESPFWEENDCNWKYQSSSLKLTREIVGEDLDKDYWKRLDYNTGCSNAYRHFLLRYSFFVHIEDICTFKPELTSE